MKRTKRSSLWVIAACLLLIGCNRKVLPAAGRDTIDSVRVEHIETIREVFVDVPVPVERLESVVPPDTVSTLTSSLAVSTAGIRGGMLWHTLEHRAGASLSAVIPVVDTRIAVDHVRREVIRELYPVPAELTRWQRFRMRVGGWALVALAVYIGWFAIKRLISARH